MRCLLASWVVWALIFPEPPLSYLYVGQTAQMQPREGLTPRKVRERRGSLEPKGGGPKSLQGYAEAAKEKDPRVLTSKIKGAQTTDELFGVLSEAVEVSYFNDFHASAAYHSLAKFHRKDKLPQKWVESPWLLKLHSRVEGMVQSNRIREREFANVFWALAVLVDAVGSGAALLATMVKAFPAKARSMNAFDLSNCLWASSQLKDEVPDVLKTVPCLVVQIPGKASEMIPQALSNSLWASAHLKDDAPDVLKAVPALVAEIPRKSSEMVPQALSNCLWASAHLKDEAPDVLKAVPALVARIQNLVT